MFIEDNFCDNIKLKVNISVFKIKSKTKRYFNLNKFFSSTNLISAYKSSLSVVIIVVYGNICLKYVFFLLLIEIDIII